jgi:hypothetical protein
VLRKSGMSGDSQGRQMGEALMDKKTMSVPEAGRVYFDLGRNASYEAARRGEIPCVKIGARLRVPVVAMERMLEQATTKVEALPHEKRAP